MSPLSSVLVHDWQGHWRVSLHDWQGHWRVGKDTGEFQSQVFSLIRHQVDNPNIVNSTPFNGASPSLSKVVT